MLINYDSVRDIIIGIINKYGRPSEKARVIDFLKRQKYTEIDSELLIRISKDLSRYMKDYHYAVFSQHFEEGPGITCEISKNQAVIKITVFRRNIAVVRNIMAKVKDCSHITFDVRDCGGGSAETCGFILQYFIKKAPCIFYSFNEKTEYMNMYGISTIKQKYTMPITVLINRNTYSAGRIFAAFMKQHGAEIKGRINKTKSHAIVNIVQVPIKSNINIFVPTGTICDKNKKPIDIEKIIEL